MHRDFRFVLPFLIWSALLAIGIDRCKTSWFDEDVYASKAVYWHEERMPAETAYYQFMEYSSPYFITHPILLGTWYDLFGVGLLQTRLFNLFVAALIMWLFWNTIRSLGFARHYAYVGALLVGLNVAVVWQVRSGRPDLLAVLMVSLSVYSLCRLTLPERYAAKSVVGWSGLFIFACALAVLCHAYAVPAIALLLTVYVASLRGRGSLAKRSLIGAVLATAIVLLGYAFYGYLNWDRFVAAWSAHTRFVNEVSDTRTSLTADLAAEFKRVMRGSLIQVFQWMVIVLGSYYGAWRRRDVAFRYRTGAMWGIACVWFLGYCLTLFWWVPKGTWYQMVYVAVPVSCLAVFGLKSLVDRFPNRKKFVFGFGTVLLLGEGVVFASLYPIAAVCQWESRSHSALTQQLSEYVKPGDRVAVDFGA
ncbi:MAG: hypothetical protein D6763_09875, partial [Alphaproteobacteria bacterium]